MLFRSVSQSRYGRRIKELKQKFNKEIIKAIRVTDEASARTFSQFEDEVDMLIFDRPAMEKTAKFDWKILSKLKITKPYLGFVFYPKSPRNLTPEQAKELKKL